jgi:dihydrofolate synthase/folylpolyglutamate synthase
VARALRIDLSTSNVITVAGTNGKGSCVAALNAVLRAAGYSVGCFTSPHFLRYNERVIVNDKPVSDEDLIASFDRIDQARGNTSLTYFEFGTLAALDLFQRAGLDVVVLEVGLGGRLDAVNIIDADVAVVTSIALDHQEWLGNDIEQIGREKAGIFRSGKPALCGEGNAPVSVAAYADEIAARFYQRDSQFRAENGSKGWCWNGLDANDNAVTLTGLPKTTLPQTSLVVAIQAIQLLDVSIPESAYQALSRIKLPGRFQREPLQRGELILDVAHNPAAALHFAQQLEAQPVCGKTYALFAIMADKDVEAVVAAMAGSIDHWLLVGLPEIPRAITADKLAKWVGAHSTASYDCYPDPQQAFHQAKQRLQNGDRLVVFGSFFTVAAVLPELSLEE